MPKFLSDGLFSGTSTDLEVGGTLDVTGKITTASDIELRQYGYVDFGTDSNNRLQLFNSLSGATLKQWGSGNLHIYSVSNGIDFQAGGGGLGSAYGLKVVGESIRTPILYETGDTSVYLDLGNTTTSLKTAGPIITTGVNQFKSVGGTGSSVSIELKGNSSGSNSDYLAKSTIKTMYDTTTPSGGTANNNSMMQFRVGKGTDAFQHTVLTLDSSLDATFAGTIGATNFSGSSSGTNTGDQDLSGYLTSLPSHNHDTRYTSTDASGDNYTFEIEDEGNYSGNKWYHVATINSGNGGLHIRGAMLNHVENFASQKFDLAIQVREANDGGQLEITGTVHVLHNESSGTDKCGIRILKTAENGNYDEFKVYIRTTRYQMLTLRLTQQGQTTFNTSHSSPLTTEPAPVSGGHVEIDTSTLAEGNYVVDDSTPKEIGQKNDDIASLAFSGTTTKTLTLTKNDGNTITGTFADTGGTSGITQSDADTRYVNVTGDAMTGNLTLNTGSQLILDTAAGNERGYIQATDTNDAHLIIATSGGEDIAFKDGGLSGTTNFLIRGNGDTLTTQNHYAKYFYDSNNTSYYLNPSSSSGVAVSITGRIDSYAEAGEQSKGLFTMRSLHYRRYGMNSYTQGMSVFTSENNTSYPGWGTRGVTALSLGNTPFGTATASSGFDIFNITRANMGGYTPSSGQGNFSKVLNLRGNGDLYLGHTGTVGAVYAAKYYDKVNTNYYLDPNTTGTSLKAAGTLVASTSNMSSYQLNGTTVMDSSRNLVNIAGITSTSKATLGNSTTDKVVIAGNLGLGDLTHPKIAYPGKAASWDGSGTTTGQIVIDLPGDLNEYDMSYIEIDVYEYSSDAASKIIIGGHNWNSGGNSNTSSTMWHNVNVQVIGSLSKSIYFGRRNDGSKERRCIAIGETNSSWAYGVVQVAKISGACYYTDSIDWLGDWNVEQTTSASYFTKNPTANQNTTNSKTLRTPGYLQAGGSVRAPLFYDSNDSTYYLNPAGDTSINTKGAWRCASSTWDGEFSGKIQYHGSYWYMQTANGVYIRNSSGSNNVTLASNGVCTAANDWRAPQFYDSADTNYYLDPNTTGTSLKVAGKIEHQGIVPTTGTGIDQIKEFSTSLQLTADTWTDTGINSTDLATGTYAVQVFVDDYGVGGNHYSEIYSGMMSWYSSNPNEASFMVDEITLHRAGHAPNDGHIQLRTERVPSADPNDLMLQVKHNKTYSAALDNGSGKAMRFKFRRLI